MIQQQELLHSNKKMNKQKHELIEHEMITKSTAPMSTTTTSKNDTGTTGKTSITTWPQIAKTTNHTQDYCWQHRHIEDVFKLEQIDILYCNGWPKKYNYGDHELERIDNWFGNGWSD